MPDGRIVFLQQSLDKVPVGEVLVTNIPALVIDILSSANDPYSIHIHYDLSRDVINTYEMRHEDSKPNNLSRDVINTYEMRQEDSKPIIAYGIHDRPYLRTRVPANLTFRNIVGPVEEILQSVEIASNKIMWKKPEPTRKKPEPTQVISV